MLKRVKQDWLIFVMIGSVGFFGQKIFNFAFGNFEKMSEKFVLLEYYEKAEEKRDKWMERVENKIDSLLKKGLK